MMGWHTSQWHSRGWLIGLALAGLILILASLLTFDLYDPTITNLRHPSGGISNLVGLPGALVGGSLVEFLGASSLWIPLLLANWLLIPARRRDLGPYLLFGGSAILFSAALHGLLSQATIPAITAPGLVGIAGSRWMLRATEISVAAPLLCAALVFALAQVMRPPDLRPAFREMGIITLYVLRMPLARGRGLWQAIALRVRAAGRHLGQGLGRLRLNRPRMGSWINIGGWSGQKPPPANPSAGTGEVHRTPLAARGSQSGESPLQPLAQAAHPNPHHDGFNSWISALGRPGQGTESADKT